VPENILRRILEVTRDELARDKQRLPQAEVEARASAAPWP